MVTGVGKRTLRGGELDRGERSSVPTIENHKITRVEYNREPIEEGT